MESHGKERQLSWPSTIVGFSIGGEKPGMCIMLLHRDVTTHGKVEAAYLA